MPAASSTYTAYTHCADCYVRLGPCLLSPRTFCRGSFRGRICVQAQPLQQGSHGGQGLQGRSKTVNSVLTIVYAPFYLFFAGSFVAASASELNTLSLSTPYLSTPPIPLSQGILWLRLHPSPHTVCRPFTHCCM